MVAHRTRGGFDLSSRLKITEENNIVTNMDCIIEVPSRFLEINMGFIGLNVLVFGVFAITFADNKYMVSNIPAMVELVPDKFIEVMHDDVPYYQFSFKANEVVFKKADVIRIDTMMYDLISEFVFKGKVPWYVEPMDLAKLFDFASSVAASNVGSNLQVIELIASIVTRSKNNRNELIRHTLKSYDDLKKHEYVPMASVYYGIRSPLNKMSGAYFQDGVVSALITEAEAPGRVESVIRA